MRLSIIFFFLVLFPCFHLCGSQSYNAIFSFGDSLSDTGNVVVAGLPYGMSFFGRPTGRCSNGRLVIDFIAEALGLPLLPPSTAKGKSFPRGANFAYTAATTLGFRFFHRRGLSSGLWVNASLSTQIRSFEQMMPSLCNSSQECKEYFGKSLFVVGEFGGNDYNTPIFAGRSLKQVYTFVPKVIHAIHSGVERLIGHGATEIVVPGMLPIGCFPMYLTLYSTSNTNDYTDIGCLNKFNHLTSYHNSLLRRRLRGLQRRYSRTRIRYADFFDPTIQFITSPTQYGEFLVSISERLPPPQQGKEGRCNVAGFSGGGALRACCGAGGRGDYNVNLEAKCAEPGSEVCSDPSTYVSWDGIHLTEAAYRLVANGWLKGPYANPPILQQN